VTLAGLTWWNLQTASGFDMTPASSGVFNDLSSAFLQGMFAAEAVGWYDDREQHLVDSSA